eukprot:TRINITY_DN2601_c0_g1_i1.p1 TRINITY_DN2601_c0_g1~~TRINITY_DN2601_c0_g1_i1.p1  ORF type:complete len:258 (+),score=62.77 TRINITY_DN2601_c0_g1_i1:661-1434(+)
MLSPLPEERPPLQQVLAEVTSAVKALAQNRFARRRALLADFATYCARRRPVAAAPDRLLPVVPQQSKSVKLLTDIEIGCVIGEGNFGKVYRGEWSGMRVALKTTVDLDRTALLLEATILSTLRAPNILQVLGVCEIDCSSYLVMELAEGSVLSLVRRTHLCLRTKLRMARDVAAAMHYLATRNVFHRDLGARNVLWRRRRRRQRDRLGHDDACNDCDSDERDDDDGYIVLVSDFGLALKLQGTDAVARGQQHRQVFH